MTMRMALIMKTIMQNCMPQTVKGIQHSALTEGVFLRHLLQAIFSENYDQQQVTFAALK